MKKKFKTILKLAFLFFLLSFISFLLYKRISFETKNKFIEIAVRYTDIEEMCLRENYPISNLLERLKAIGVSSILLNEYTITSLIEKKGCVLFYPEEVRKLKSIDVISSTSIIEPYTMIIYDDKLSKDLCSIVRYKTKTNLKEWKISPRTTVINLGNVWEKIKDMGLGFNRETMEMIKRCGLKLILELKSIPDFEYVFNYDLKEVSSIMFDTTLELDKSELKRFMANLYLQRVKFPIFEFQNYSNLKHLFLPFKSITLRAHTIEKIEEMNKYTPERLIIRYMRAINERNCKLLLHRMFPAKNTEENLDFLRRLVKNLKSKKLKVGLSEPSEAISILPPLFVQLFVMLTAIFPPVFSYFKFSNLPTKFNIKESIKVFLFVSCITTFTGVLISALFALDSGFLLKIVEFVGVRFAFFFPLFLISFFQFRREVKKILDKPFTLRYLIYITAFAFLFFIIFVRFGFTFTLPLEQELKDFLDKILLIRPRIKEFLFGHPILLYALYTKNPLLMILGFIGQVSIINTFLHPAVPFSISLLKTIYGLFFGIILGLLLIWLSRRKLIY